MSVYIAGAGGFGRETLDAAIAVGVEVTAFLDDAKAGLAIRGLPVLLPGDVHEGSFVVGIADPAARAELVTRLYAAGLTPLNVIHPRSVIGPETRLGAGCVVLAQAHISSSVRIEDHVQVNYNATVGHDAVLDSFVTIYPGANVSGNVHLGRGVTMGSNSCVLQGLRIGRNTFVGAGAVVTKDQPEGVTLVGVPARPLGGDRLW
jgi:sugar O-acyltransferase (sialic acid O-acetyltransferase NeuD family)